MLKATVAALAAARPPRNPDPDRPRGPVRASARAPRRDRVPVPCVTCGKPTTLKVDPAMLDEIEVFHICDACFKSDLPALK